MVGARGESSATLASQAMVTVPFSDIAENVTLRQPVFDPRPGHKQLLLAAGTQLTRALLDALGRRGITSILVSQTEADNLTRKQAAPAPAPSSSTASQTTLAPGEWKVTADSFANQVHKPATLARDPHTASAFEEAFRRTVEATEVIVEEFAKLGQLEAQQVHAINEEHLHQICVDVDEFVSRGLTPVTESYPSRHSLQTAMLATTVGVTMGLPRSDLLELGFGCVLHDAGMLLIPPQILHHAQRLTTADRLELQKHPIHAANLLTRCRDVPQGARHVVYQMHERMNGSGYPRQRLGTQIHPLARIAAIADVYVSLVSPRAYRPALDPYRAIEKLLYATRQGLFDPLAMRALLHTVSLFPIGSLVKLSDGRIARVLRSNGERFDRPTVAVMDFATPSAPSEVLDLTTQKDLRVVSTMEETPGLLT